MRIPLASDFKNRTGNPDRDARQRNSYIEVKGDQAIVRKRPSAQGGIPIGTGAAQGGIGLNINGVPYFIGFWADTMQSYSGGGISGGWNSGTSYAIGDMVLIPEDDADPFIGGPPTPYYAYAPSTNKSPRTNPDLWKPTTPPPSTRFYLSISGSTNTICATREAAAAVDFPNFYATVDHSCPPSAPGYIWYGNVYRIVGNDLFGDQYGTAGYRECGDPLNGPYNVQIGGFVQVV